MEEVKRKVGKEELAGILSSHAMWLIDSDKGTKADLSNCFLRGHWFEQVDLRGANLAGVDLMYTKMLNIKFNGANLQNANFISAKLNNVDFYRANLQGAQFDYEYLNKVNLEGVLGL